MILNGEEGGKFVVHTHVLEARSASSASYLIGREAASNNEAGGGPFSLGGGIHALSWTYLQQISRDDKKTVGAAMQDWAHPPRVVERLIL